MKLPPAAMGQIKKAVVAMMPYESEYEYQSKESKIFNDIYLCVCTHEPEFEEWAGFVMFVSKKIDNSTSLQKSVNAIVHELDIIIKDYLNEI